MMDKLTLPNLLSSSRLVLAPISMSLVANAYWLASAIVIALAVVTDLLDGYLARRRNQTSAFGGLLDHMSDAIFVVLTLVGLSMLGVVTVILPVIVAVAFVQYLLDSRALAGEPLRASKLGRYNGIAYFVLAGFPSMQHALALYPVPMPGFLWASWILVGLTLISMLDRLIALMRRSPAL